MELQNALSSCKGRLVQRETQLEKLRALLQAARSSEKEKETETEERAMEKATEETAQDPESRAGATSYKAVADK